MRTEQCLLVRSDASPRIEPRLGERNDIQRCQGRFILADRFRTSVEPQKADLLLLRRSRDRDDENARVLRRLWPELTRETLVELKSVGRALRRGDWIRLLGYGAQHHSKQIKRLDLATDLTLVLVVPSWTPTIDRETRSLGWTLNDLGCGYYRVHGTTE